MLTDTPVKMQLKMENDLSIKKGNFKRSLIKGVRKKQNTTYIRKLFGPSSLNVNIIKTARSKKNIQNAYVY